MAEPDFRKNPKTQFKDPKKMGRKEAREEIEAIRGPRPPSLENWTCLEMRTQ
jgi:hypothetical protein